MREHSTPSAITVDPTDSLIDAVARNAEQAPQAVAFRRRGDSGWTDITAAAFAQQVRQAAKGLIGKGVQPGDRVGLMCKTRYEWTLLDYAIWTAGAVTVPVYETSSAEQVGWIASDSAMVVLLVETQAHADVVEKLRSQVRELREVLVIDTGGVGQLTEAGAEVEDAELDRRRTTLTTDSLATIIYTSGTTGRPKGCELTHGSFLFDVRTTVAPLGQLFNATGSTLLFLPLAHVFARAIQVGCVENQVTMGHSADVSTLLPDFQAFRPTFILAVPRVFEKVYNGSKQKAHGDGKGKIFDRAEKVAIDFSRASTGGAVPLALRLQHAVFDRLVYAKLRAAMGGQISYAVSGGAPLGERLGHFFRGIGVTVLEGYGLTETAAGATVNTPDRLRIGTVGQPLPGVAVRIESDGEISLRGDNVFRGYWQNEAATKEVLDADGWFHTGDIGELDASGYLSITGRKKELIVTAGGKNVAPAVLEDRLRAHPLVGQCLVVGDAKPFIAALVTIDPDAFPAWRAEHGKPDSASVADLANDAELRATVQAAVDDANLAVSKAESIRAFTILAEDFSEASGHMTPSMKVKRAAVMRDHSGEIDAIYSARKE